MPTSSAPVDPMVARFRDLAQRAKIQIAVVRDLLPAIAPRRLSNRFSKWHYHGEVDGNVLRRLSLPLRTEFAVGSAEELSPPDISPPRSVWWGGRVGSEARRGERSLVPKFLCCFHVLTSERGTFPTRPGFRPPVFL